MALQPLPLHPLSHSFSPPACYLDPSGCQHEHVTTGISRLHPFSEEQVQSAFQTLLGRARAPGENFVLSPGKLGELPQGEGPQETHCWHIALMEENSLSPKLRFSALLFSYFQGSMSHLSIRRIDCEANTCATRQLRLATHPYKAAISLVLPAVLAQLIVSYTEVVQESLRKMVMEQGTALLAAPHSEQEKDTPSLTCVSGVHIELAQGGYCQSTPYPLSAHPNAKRKYFASFLEGIGAPTPIQPLPQPTPSQYNPLERSCWDQFVAFFTELWNSLLRCLGC